VFCVLHPLRAIDAAIARFEVASEYRQPPIDSTPDAFPQLLLCMASNFLRRKLQPYQIITFPKRECQKMLGQVPIKRE